MQQAREAVSTNAIAFVKWSGQSLVEFKQNAQALIEQGVIQGLQLLDDGAKWVVNGAEYSAKLLIGAGVYTLKLGAKGLVYLVEGGKEIAITIVRNVQEVYKNGVALARLAGQNAKTFVANAEIAIKDGAIKTIQMAADGVNFMIDGQKYMTKVLI
ncbi:MAG: hypothetical protein LBG59_03705 [Candidatus Peribacteria bacterium]|jgi:hypothetical protein|nr:hypothetical protein [Candidatus Peribacteria bacterium]